MIKFSKDLASAAVKQSSVQWYALMKLKLSNYKNINSITRGPWYEETILSFQFFNCDFNFDSSYKMKVISQYVPWLLHNGLPSCQPYDKVLIFCPRNAVWILLLLYRSLQSLSQRYIHIIYFESFNTITYNKCATIIPVI